MLHLGDYISVPDAPVTTSASYAVEAGTSTLTTV